jgi:hypothetical protein
MYKTYRKAQRKKHPHVVRHTRRPKCKYAGCNKHAVSGSGYCREHNPRRVSTLNDIKSSEEDSEEDSEEEKDPNLQIIVPGKCINDFINSIDNLDDQEKATILANIEEKKFTFEEILEYDKAMHLMRDLNIKRRTANHLLDAILAHNAKPSEAESGEIKSNRPRRSTRRRKQTKAKTFEDIGLY